MYDCVPGSAGYYYQSVWCESVWLLRDRTCACKSWGIFLQIEFYYLINYKLKRCCVKYYLPVDENRNTYVVCKYHVINIFWSMLQCTHKQMVWYYLIFEAVLPHNQIIKWKNIMFISNVLGYLRCMNFLSFSFSIKSWQYIVDSIETIFIIHHSWKLYFFVFE